MNSVRNHIKYILLSFIFFLFSSLTAQNSLDGEYIMIQYLAESASFRFAAVYQIIANSDNTGTWKEMHPAAVPDSGLFDYESRPDRTFTIFDGESDLQGTIDDSGEIFTMVQDDTSLALIAIGIKKTAGRSNSDLTGAYYVSEYFAEDSSQASTFNLITFDGAGSAKLNRLKVSVSESGNDTVSFNYQVDEDGGLTLDNRLTGVLSANGQVFTAAWSDSGRNSIVIGIKKSTAMGDTDLLGHFTYNQLRGESTGDDRQTDFYARLFLDGQGEGFITMFDGEPFNGQISYAVSEDGQLEFADSDGAVSADGKYFFSVETIDSTSVAFGFGITVEDPFLALEDDESSLPSQLTLHQNYPNPFNPATMINYELPITNYVDLSVYNLLGQKVVSLISGEQPAGKYSVQWDAADFPSGIYFYVLRTAEGLVQTRKMMLIK